MKLEALHNASLSDLSSIVLFLNKFKKTEIKTQLIFELIRNLILPGCLRLAAQSPQRSLVQSFLPRRHSPLVWNQLLPLGSLQQRLDHLRLAIHNGDVKGVLLCRVQRVDWRALVKKELHYFVGALLGRQVQQVEAVTICEWHFAMIFNTEIQGKKRKCNHCFLSTTETEGMS